MTQSYKQKMSNYENDTFFQNFARFWCFFYEYIDQNLPLTKYNVLQKFQNHMYKTKALKLFPHKVTRQI